MDECILYLLTGSDEPNSSQRESLAFKDHDTVGLAVVVQQRHAGTDKHTTNSSIMFKHNSPAQCLSEFLILN